MSLGICNDYQFMYFSRNKPELHNYHGEYIYCERDSLGNPIAVIHGRHLAWDTKVLGVQSARLDLLWIKSSHEIRNLIDGLTIILEEMRQDGIDFCDCRVSCATFELIHLLEENGFRLMDVLNIYRSERSPQLKINNMIGYKLKSGIIPTCENIRQILTFSDSLFLFSRIYQDKHITKDKANNFYHHLLLTILRNPENYVVLAMDSSENVVGLAIGCHDFDTITAANYGYLWLIAVAPAHKGKGLGKVLLNHFLVEMHKTCPVVEIGTQVNNLAANALYQQIGLRANANVTSFHRWFL